MLDAATQQRNAFQTAFFGRNILRQRKEAAMGLTHSLSVLMIGAAFLFIATMIFI